MLQKVLHVVAGKYERNKIPLNIKIEKSVKDFVDSINGDLLEFKVNESRSDEEGFGHALVTVNYEVKESKKEVKEK